MDIDIDELLLKREQIVKRLQELIDESTLVKEEIEKLLLKRETILRSFDAVNSVMKCSRSASGDDAKRE